MERSPIRFLWEGIEGFVLLAAVLLTWPVSRRWLRNWGCRPGERGLRWRGDDFIKAPEDLTTRAIDIKALPEEVWPWVVQFGLGRAGFYSYELLERLVGIPVRNVESIVPRFQHLEVGDSIKLHPSAPPIPVAAVESNHCLCFAQIDTAEEWGASSDPARSWSIYLRPTEESSCCLLVRTCLGPIREPSWVKRLFLAVEAPIDFLMEQRMLRTIKRLAEAR